jgi:carboxylate-amine ligase
MAAQLPDWAQWRADPEIPQYTVGIEEEVMLLDPTGWSLAHTIDEVLPALASALGSQATAETHGAALELATRPHATVGDAIAELGELRGHLSRGLQGLGLRAAVAGTHPFAVWRDTQVSGGERYQFLYGSMRELARREPTFALHVHVGISRAEDAVRVFNRLRAHLPLLLALSANSPFWQGRDTGLASARTPLFQAFPRVGIPRAFANYREYVEAIDLLIRCEALPEPTFLWWDVRLQPRFGTVEVRVMDSQTRLGDTAGIVGLLQATARLELEEGWVPPELVNGHEVLSENRFLAARDGMDAGLIDPIAERAVPARDILERLVSACRPYARDLGGSEQLDCALVLSERPGEARQRESALGPERLPGLMSRLSDEFLQPPGAVISAAGDQPNRAPAAGA